MSKPWPHNLQWRCVEHDVPATYKHLDRFDYKCHVKLNEKAYESDLMVTDPLQVFLKARRQ